MEIVSIEAGTYEEIMNRFEEFVGKVNDLCDRSGNKTMGKWLDSQDVCFILNISPRSLQTLRESGRLAYTLVGRKSFYKAEDVESVISVLSKRKEVKNV